MVGDMTRQEVVDDKSKECKKVYIKLSEIVTCRPNKHVGGC